MNTEPLIQFRLAEGNQFHRPHHDALVIIATIANYDVDRIFISDGSSIDVPFNVAYKQKDLGDMKMESVDTALFSFAGEMANPLGQTQLPLVLAVEP
ncbi:hypothetical protein BUALT_Bualt01G0125600 [Buddleja alternifolia]|uniref:Uncharacterized protein n=1 Tax=Buddleja alternifolia TaxID=168488 RepID=A0AAV6Y835_9LAMI|nr:hypothetical protein BUALT_Bualt01G0125600 [Buddleja alternifolia]